MRKLFNVGIIGAVVAAVCCFTPLLVWILAGIGLVSVIAWLDFILIPALLIFAGLAAFAFWRIKMS